MDFTLQNFNAVSHYNKESKEFDDYEFNSLFWDVYNTIDLENIHEQCVIFIQWFNEQKQ